MDVKLEEIEMVTSFAKTYKFFRFEFSNSKGEQNLNIPSLNTVLTDRDYQSAHGS
jgi:hypothetical protein